MLHHAINHQALRATLSVMLSLILVLALTGCERRPAAFAFRSSPVDGWEQGDTLRFHIDSLRKAGDYQLTLGLRTSASTPCPFQCIWLVMRQQWHNPDTLINDTIECRLTDTKGDVLGDGVSLYTITCPVRQLQLHQGTSADISIHHIMRREMLTGVSDVGIRLDRE